jgi:hypothetical protein
MDWDAVLLGNGDRKLGGEPRRRSQVVIAAANQSQINVVFALSTFKFLEIHNVV